MAKKDFKNSMASSLTRKEEEQKEEPKSTSELGTQPGETRATVLIRKDLLEQVKAMAYWERLKLKEVTEIAFEDLVEKYKKKHGNIEPIPEDDKRKKL